MDHLEDVLSDKVKTLKRRKIESVRMTVFGYPFFGLLLSKCS